MSKKDFIALADMVKNHNSKLVEFRNPGYTTEMFYEAQLEVLAQFCAKYPRFDRQLWLNYIEGNCGPSGR
jgi:hypothetical protein